MTGTILAGKYRIEELIGAGGMAEVYKAVQLSSPQRTVAIKMLKAEYEKNAAFVRRFEQEAQAVLGLSHDHIVRSYDVGIYENVHYIVLEYVEGETLTSRIKARGKLTPRQTVAIGAEVLDALSHAHERGVIHRDVKPQNILITNKGKAKLADFGIARLTATDNTQTFMGTSVMGSVQYISPEQAKGEPVSIESDLYSMGVTLYEMITGELPFSGETSVSIAIKHIHEKVVPPVALDPDMPFALNDIIMRALSKDPAQRYHSAKAMRQDLLRVLREPNGTYAAMAAVGREKRFSRRGILRIAAFAFAVLALFAVLLFMRQAYMPAESGSELVPLMTGKTLDEAKNIAKLRSYTLEVTDTIMSDQYESGIVISQYPLAGTALKSGSTVQIVLSAGNIDALEVYAPDLTNLTLQEATDTLAELGLKTGEVEYSISEQPPGTVIRQEPLPNTLLLVGDEVNLYISGEPPQGIEAPEVSNLPLQEALSLLRERGFRAFRVQMAAPEENLNNPNVVVKQSPASGEPFPSTGYFMLTVSGTALYAVDLSIPINIASDGSSLLVAINREINGIAYEQVVYEASLKAGEQEISFTAATQEGGDYQVVIYLNGSLLRQTNAIFSYRG